MTLKNNKKEIIEITSEKAKEILEGGEEGSFKPIGSFYHKDGELWVGLDNSTGDCWVEEFETKELCIAWLKGEFEISELEEYKLQQKEAEGENIMEVKSRYLVALDEEYARDIQIAATEEAHNDPFSRDWNDFSGPIVLGIYESSNEKELIQVVSANCNVPAKAITLHQLYPNSVFDQFYKEEIINYADSYGIDLTEEKIEEISNFMSVDESLSQRIEVSIQEAIEHLEKEAEA